MIHEPHDRTTVLRCDAEAPTERYSKDSSGYWSAPPKKNVKSQRRKSFHENPHSIRPNNTHSEEHPGMRLTKAGTLPRELCHPAVRVKPKHMASLHNLCENNHADHRQAIVY